MSKTTRLMFLALSLGSAEDFPGAHGLNLLAATNAMQVSAPPPRVERIGHGVSAPQSVSKTEPEYSEEARRALVTSTIVLSLIVRQDGSPSDIRVIRGAGFGLDERAIEAMQKWRFNPGKREGKPVAVLATVEVNFRFRLDDARFSREHGGQTARLSFSLPASAARPELTTGRIPKNPAASGDQFLRIRIQVNEKVRRGTSPSWRRLTKNGRTRPCTNSARGAFALRSLPTASQSRRMAFSS